MALRTGLGGDRLQAHELGQDRVSHDGGWSVGATGAVAGFALDPP